MYAPFSGKMLQTAISVDHSAMKGVKVNLIVNISREIQLHAFFLMFELNYFPLVI